MTQLRLAWIFVKKHWKVFAMAAWSIGIFIFARKNNQAAIETMEARKESYESQIQALQDARNTEIQKREELTLKYKETLAKIEDKYSIKKEQLSRKEKKKVKEIIKKAESKPNEINNKLEELFGFTVTD
jgi:type VI protein secretion system component VasK|tara:strand:+ start:23889 stop:24275 length:387 start_codon:yes stop_codon:yes gene_type:complete